RPSLGSDGPMRFSAWLLLGILASTTTGAAAQTPTEPQAPPSSTARDGLGFGVRGGLGSDPAQVVLGIHFSAGKALDFVRIVPNVHLSFGDFSTVDLQVDFLLRAVLQDAGLGIYGGLAPGLFIPTGEEGETDLGASFVAGLQLPLIPN